MARKSSEANKVRSFYEDASVASQQLASLRPKTLRELASEYEQAEEEERTYASSCRELEEQLAANRQSLESARARKTAAGQALGERVSRESP